MKKSALLLAAAVPASAFWSLPAVAQDAAPAQAQSGAETGDIIVTARKRQESILFPWSSRPYRTRRST